MSVIPFRSAGRSGAGGRVPPTAAVGENTPAAQYWMKRAAVEYRNAMQWRAKVEAQDLLVQRLRIALAVATRPDSQHRVDQPLTNH